LLSIHQYITALSVPMFIFMAIAVIVAVDSIS
jgi:hypothetical protein